MDFKNIPKQYRPIPFWSWNSKLEVGETKEQVKRMHEAGIGGFFMHARGGLQTEYMSEEWFDNVTAANEAAQEYGMRPWAYDENGWPSGFGNGAVNGLGVEYQQKYLRVEKENAHLDTHIAKCGDYYFYYEVNPFYVDTLDEKVIKKFIETTYEPYYARYGTQIEGFFTDEPQISRNGIPWSFVFEEEYQKRYQENLLEHLDQLFFPVGDYKDTRVKFWKMVTELFSSAYMKQIYDWCEERGLKLTGHLVLEESLSCQLASNGACMPHYEYFHIPGMDWLGRDISDCLTPIQVSSAAEQLGKDSVLSETFAMCGHNVSFAELKGIYEWQMVHGVNLLCQHLEGYSLRGIRKRDYPPAMYIQQPWWEEYHRFNDAMSRVGKILREGYHPVDVLVLHPQTTAWTLYDDQDDQKLYECNQKFLAVIKELEEKHIQFHLGDEILMERHGSVSNGKITIANYSYTYVVDPGCEVLLPNTKKLLEEFKKQGGAIITAKELTAENVVDNPGITYTKRICDGQTIHYFVNTSPKYEQANIPICGNVLDIYSGEESPFSGVHEFEPWGSLMLIENAEAAVKPQDAPKTYILPAEEMHIISCDANNLTLDRCDYYFDDELQEENGYVLNIVERATALERPVHIHQDYHVQMDYIPKELYLACETPEKFTISINGKPLENIPMGYYVDKSFQKIEIAEYMCLGANTISFDCDFRPSEQFYEDYRKSQIFESEKNKLVYDIEIEAIYLLGDFRVRTDGKWNELKREAMRYTGSFVIDRPLETLSVKHMEMQGYPFFCGKMCLEGKIDIHGENPVLKIDRKGINVVSVEIGDVKKYMLTNDQLPLKDFGAEGTVAVKYTLINNLRNLLGPHHLEEGECYLVGPHSFFAEPCVWNENPAPAWNDDYCFVEMGI